MRLDFTVHLSHEDRARLDRIAAGIESCQSAAAAMSIAFAATAAQIERIADHLDPLPKSHITWSVSEQPEKKE